MKKDEFLSVFHALQSGKKRTSLAVAVGVLAMLLLLLSELLPAGTRRKRRHPPPRQLPSASTRHNWNSSWKD